VADKYHWRLLRVGLDGLTFWGKSIRVGDLLARKGRFEEALDKIQELLEVIYPLGSEIYRDENGSIFIVPNIDNLLIYTDSTQSLERHIQDIANQVFAGETDFTLTPSPSTRNTLVFGSLACIALPQPTSRPSWLKQQWQNKSSDICSVCGLRPHGPSDKARKRKVCDTCQMRRVNRSRQWINNPSTTIWIDEVANVNGQVALLVAHFSLADWLSGNFFNTVLSFDPESRLLSDEKQKLSRPPDYYFDLRTLTNNIQDGLIPGHKFEDNLLGYLVQDNQKGNSDAVQDFYDLHVTETDLGVFSSSPKPGLLTLSMIRQFPSFARINRVWETTKRFWQEIESTFHTTVGTVNTRLKIQGVFLRNGASQDTLGISHTYVIRSGSTSLSVTCIKDQEFLTVDNLHRIAVLLEAPEEFRQNYNIASEYVRRRLLQSESVQIEEPTGYGSPNRSLGSLRIEDVTLEISSYLPAISILTEPRTFMALVPADKAWQVAKTIKEKYEKEMGKVRNRLPLTLGVVFAGARTPLPAILDAGRRMLKQPAEATHWRVKEVDLRPYPEKVLLTLGPREGEEPSLILDIPAIMGDEVTEDAWYPYWCLEEEVANASERKRKFKGIDERYWTHVSDLQVGDVVSFMPSRFDFEYLDTAARRFEISYENGKRRGIQQPGSSYHPARPYYLEQLDKFDQLWEILSHGLETTQIHTLIGIIEVKRMEWSADQNNEMFKRFVYDALNNANWKPHLKPERFDLLCEAALSGQLADTVELYMQILNQQPEADKSQTQIAGIGVNS
jgi:CRISPR-associated Csx11 family protein